jgi:hypothetical protein
MQQLLWGFRVSAAALVLEILLLPASMTGALF